MKRHFEQKDKISETFSFSILPNTGRITITPNEFIMISGLGRTKTFSLIREGKLKVVRLGRRKTLITVESALALIMPESRQVAYVSAGKGA